MFSIYSAYYFFYYIPDISSLFAVNHLSFITMLIGVFFPGKDWICTKNISMILFVLLTFILLLYDRLRSASRLKSASTHVIISNHGPILRYSQNRRPFQMFRSMADLLVSVRAYVSDTFGRQFEKVKNSHRFQNWTPIWEFKERT